MWQAPSHSDARNPSETFYASLTSFVGKPVDDTVEAVDCLLAVPHERERNT